MNTSIHRTLPNHTGPKQVHAHGTPTGAHAKPDDTRPLVPPGADPNTSGDCRPDPAISPDDLNVLLGALDQAIVELDLDERFAWVAPTRFGLHAQRENLIGRTLQDMLPPELGLVLHTLNTHVLETGETLDAECQMQVAGRPAWFAVTIALMGTRGTLWVGRDITERKEANQALR